MDERLKLLRAVGHGNADAVREMYDHRSTGFTWKDCTYDHTGDSALHVAARAGHLQIIRSSFTLFAYQ